jgi:hypothetical protein
MKKGRQVQVDESPGSVRNAERAPTRGLVTFETMWLPGTGKTSKGTKPQGRNLSRNRHFVKGGSGVLKLWRGAKGQERLKGAATALRQINGAKTSEVKPYRPRPERERRNHYGR